jgi:imidazole glycerol-phosphate synthase subunit HisF
VLCKRLIACLDVRNGRVVKGTNFTGLRDAGDPSELARRYDSEGVDEVVLLDVSATLEGRRAMVDTVKAAASRVFIPLTVGGGIRTEADAAAMFDAGADKVSINSAALEEPSIITRLAGRYGSQAVVVAIDAKRKNGVWHVFRRSGTRSTSWLAESWAHEAANRGAGEILLTSIDRDGTRDGFDLDLTQLVSSAVPIPVIASGGAGRPEHFLDVFTSGQADAALAASIFHFSEHAVAELKAFLARHGIVVRRHHVDPVH